MLGTASGTMAMNKSFILFLVSTESVFVHYLISRDFPMYILRSNYIKR